MLESSIQSKSVKILEKRGWTVIRLKAANVSGWPDIICLREPARCIFIEMKRPQGKVTLMQLSKHSILRILGFEVYVISSTDQLTRIKDAV